MMTTASTLFVAPVKPYTLEALRELLARELSAAPQRAVG
jgi:hypothetical protein